MAPERTGTVLSMFDYTGNWPRPYEEAGVLSS